jgi:hypothetical protein
VAFIHLNRDGNSLITVLEKEDEDSKLLGYTMQHWAIKGSSLALEFIKKLTPKMSRSDEDDYKSIYTTKPACHFEIIHH